MNKPSQDFSKFGFAKTFVLPALWIFLIPAISLIFFLHAQARYDADLRDSTLTKIGETKRLTEEEKAEAVQFYTDNPVSTLIAQQEFASRLDKGLLFDYATFRWMIRLSAVSIISGVALLLLGVCVLLSIRSLQAQYVTLAVGWNVLRVYAALQTFAQGAMLLALSFWITALWFHVYIVKLIVVAGALVLAAVLAVIRAIFAPARIDFHVEGAVLDQDGSPELWKELKTICDRVGAAPPDQIIAGIDDNFFVTQLPVTVGEKTFHGRTLYVSLALLKQLQGGEADAVLAHEMAHFSGKDTLYSKKTAPLLARYGNYLQGLYEGDIALPIFHFMLCFRSLFELSLRRLSRVREFRADRIATKITSPSAMASALLRVGAYSAYRGTIERELFERERAIQTANISQRIEQGFPQFAVSFLTDQSVGLLQTAHPFDSHPPLAQRLAAIGIEFGSADAQRLLDSPGDGAWYGRIANAVELERQQWDVFEARFREFHEGTLAYRFVPTTDEERAIVERAFPEVRFESSDGSLVIDHEKMNGDDWSQPVYFRDLRQLTLREDNRLQVTYLRDEVGSEWINLAKFGDQGQAVVETAARYHARYATAVAYQQQRQTAQQVEPPDPEWPTGPADGNPA